MTFRMKCVVGAILSSALSVAPVAVAQDLGMKAPAQTRPVIISGATVHPVSGPAIANGVVYFADGVLEKVTTAEEFAKFEATVRWASPGPERIDAKGLHVYPGLIGASTQLGLTEIESLRAPRDFAETGGVTPEVRAAPAVNPDSTLLPVTRTGGVLLVGSWPTGGSISGRASVIRLDGWTWEEMTVEADAGLVVNWPMVRPVRAWWMQTPPEEQMRRAREATERITRAFEQAQAYAKARAADQTLPTDLRFEAMRSVFPGAEPQRPVFISANDADQISASVAWAASLGLRAVIVGGTEAELCAELLKKHDVPVIVMGAHRMPRREDEAYDEAFTLPARLAKAGIRFCIASGEETAHERNLGHSAGLAANYGLGEEGAVRAITLSAAEILGVAGRYGSLEAGKSATLIVTTGSPLEVRSRVTRAFIDGRAIDLENKQSVLAEKYRERYRQMNEAGGKPGANE
jgi:imidazolonepropionase-like amidohydrolase